MTDNEQILRTAIQNKQAVHAVYDGLERWLCPHMLGWKKGRLNVLCYQYAGDTSQGRVDTPAMPSDGPPHLWKCMVVGKLQRLTLVETAAWYTCQKHTQRSSCADQVLEEVARS